MAALHIIDDGRDVDEILIRRTFVHMGRTMGFTQAEVVDAPTRRGSWPFLMEWG